MAQLPDGFSTTIAFTTSPGVLLWEKEVTPPSIMGGGAIEVSTMRNIAFRTNFPKRLKTVGEISFKAAYDVTVYPQLLALVNTNGPITVTFPDATFVVVFGWLDEFVPDPLKDGEHPTAQCKIIVSNLIAMPVAPAGQAAFELGPVQGP